MKKSLFLSVMLLAAMPAPAELVARLPQVKNPLCIALTSERVYVAEDSSQVHIYGRGAKGIAFVKTFGRQGDAPGEFNDIYHLLPLKAHLEILTLGRFVRFSPDGRFLDEMKFPIRFFKDGALRIGENFLARDFSFSEDELSVAVRLYDKDFQKLGELISRWMPRGDKINLAIDYYSVRVSGDQAYVIESGKQTRVTVYDQAGAKQGEFGLPLEPVQVSPALKQTLLRPLKNEPDWRTEDETLYGFPDWTPGLDYFEIVDGKCIARTYNYRGNLVEFAIFDLQGQELNRVFLPAVGRLSHDLLFCFFQDHYYYLRKNPDDQAWELHEEKAW